MKERVYLGDWAYNAGIIGFIEIMLDGQDIESQNILTIGPNYIEFDRSNLQGFTDKFFKKAYERYPRTDNLINLGGDLLKELTKSDDLSKNLSQKVSDYKKKVESFSKLKRLVTDKSITLPKNFSRDDAKEYVSAVVSLLNEKKQELVEEDVKTYLKSVSSICGEKSFLNRALNSDLKKKFFDDFEDPIVNQKNKYDKSHKCIFCGQRLAKKDALLDTGLVSFLGANQDNKNFFWNFKPLLPICEICELIYFCIFAGLTEFRIGQTKKFYFVDKSTSVEELYKTNKLFMEMMSKEENILKEKGILNFINSYLVLKLKEESKFRLTNIMFIEIDLTFSAAPKLYGFSITKEKAEFINSSSKAFEKIAGSFIKNKDNIIYPFTEFVQRCLNDTLGFYFLSFIEEQYLSSQKPNSKITTNLSPYKLQMYNLLTYKYLKSIKRGEELMDEKWLWRMYYFGQELKRKFLDAKAENKITSLAHKLISALRVGDVNTFMNLIIRTYMSYNMEVPGLFVSCISDKDNFYTLGYSFVNGLLGSEKVENIEEVVDND